MTKTYLNNNKNRWTFFLIPIHTIGPNQFLPNFRFRGDISKPQRKENWNDLIRLNCGQGIGKF